MTKLNFAIGSCLLVACATNQRDLGVRFAHDYSCPVTAVTVSGHTKTFTVSGCGKTARYHCPTSELSQTIDVDRCSEQSTSEGRPTAEFPRQYVDQRGYQTPPGPRPLTPP
jgi:hypothetical protein